MKKSLRLSLFAFLLISALALCFIIPKTNISSVYAKNGNKITVIGNAEIKVQPNMANVNVGVETVNAEISAAEQENSLLLNRVIEKIIASGIEKSDIKTTNFNIHKQYNYSASIPEFIGYQITNILTFKTKNIDTIGELLTDLAAEGANIFSGINFTIENESGLYNSALSAALNNARSKVAVLTEDIDNYSIKKITEENTYYNALSYCDTSSMFRNSTDMKFSVPVMQGEITVKATVKVEFEKIIEAQIPAQ